MTIWQSRTLGSADARLFWLRTADVRTALPSVLPWLDPAEAARAARFATARLREDFLASRLLLRGVLAAWLGRSPGALRFVNRPGGKPVLAYRDAPVFNLSHSHGVCVLYVAGSGEVGLDVERLRPHPQRELDLACEYFAPAECDWLAAEVEGEARQRRFLYLWTIKEAVLKAEGSGLALPLDSVAALPDSAGHPNWLALPPTLNAGELKAGWLALGEDCIVAHARWTRSLA